MTIYALLQPALFKQSDFPRYVDQRIECAITNTKIKYSYCNDICS